MRLQCLVHKPIKNLEAGLCCLFLRINTLKATDQSKSLLSDDVNVSTQDASAGRQLWDKRSGRTRLHDLGLPLRDGGVLAHSALVLCKHSELVGVAHDEVGDGGIQSMVMLQHGVPVLQTHASITRKHRSVKTPPRRV